MYELHRLPNQSSHDKIMLKAYFEDVELVSNLLEKQIKLILARTLNTVRKEPTVIVTALRIIEREEKRDQMALQVIYILIYLLLSLIYKYYKYNLFTRLFTKNIFKPFLFITLISAVQKHPGVYLNYFIKSS